MTAVVGILNKQAVALAADSAVTISGPNNRKILNRANKIFSLSKYHPVGIMIYNSASFMGVPWEPIIKSYRQKLGNKAFGTVREYWDHFLGFLRQQAYFQHTELQKSQLQLFVNEVVNAVFVSALTELNLSGSALSADNKRQVVQVITERLPARSALLRQEFQPCPELATLTQGAFLQSESDIWENIFSTLAQQNGFPVSDAFKSVIVEYTYDLFRLGVPLGPTTGLVFAGYGESEFFPSLFAVEISLPIENRLRWYAKDDFKMELNLNNQSGIFPYAQDDVIQTILSGIEPGLQRVYTQYFSNFIRNYNSLLSNTLSSEQPELAARIQNLNVDTIVRQFFSDMGAVQQKQIINPMLEAVSSLSKEDLAEMAESLIYLTFLKRRFTFADESVGGPVDVAVISKGDGFIWMKRKHYFKADLNQHFFQNYFR